MEARELFGAPGFQNVELTGGSADVGIDGYGTLANNPFVSLRRLFQCKRYAKGDLVFRVHAGDFATQCSGESKRGSSSPRRNFVMRLFGRRIEKVCYTLRLSTETSSLKCFRIELGVFKKTVYGTVLGYFEKFKY